MSSIVGFCAFPLSLDAFDFVFGTGSEAECVVVFGLLAAVGVVPDIGGDGVPEGVGLGSGGVELLDVAGSEVGLEDGLGEGDEDEVVGGVAPFQEEALQVAVVPGEVGEGGVGLDDSLGGGVPVVVGAEEAAGGEGDQGDQY